jgi:hypothetical protein
MATVVRIWFVDRLAQGEDFLCTYGSLTLNPNFVEVATNVRADGIFPGRTTTFAILSSIEPGIGIAAGCIATLRPLLQACIGRSDSPSQGTTQHIWLKPTPSNTISQSRKSLIGIGCRGDRRETKVNHPNNPRTAVKSRNREIRRGGNCSSKVLRCAASTPGLQIYKALPPLPPGAQRG